MVSQTNDQGAEVVLTKTSCYMMEFQSSTPPMRWDFFPASILRQSAM
jgi:hypothetical protein